MGFLSLVREDLRALPRSRFALLGAALMLGFAALLAATVGVQARERDDFLLPAFGIAPAILIPIAASQVASARSSRFIQGVFTSPVGEGAYVLAKTTVVFLLGLLYLAALLPFLVVEAIHLGAPWDAGRYLLFGVGMSAYAATFGTLLGILFTSRGSLAAVSTGVGVAFAVVMVFGNLSNVLQLPPGGGRAFALRAFHLSSGLLLQDALDLGGYVASRAPWRSGLAFLLLCAGSLAAAWWVFTRRQSPEGWEARGAAAGVVGLVVAALALSPAVVAEPEYDPVPGRGGGWSGGGGGIVVQVVPRGGMPLAPKTPFERTAIAAGAASEVDLLVFLHGIPGAREPYANASFRFSGENLTVEPATAFLQPQSPLPRAAPQHFTDRELPYLRVPVVLTPSAPEALAGNVHTLEVNLTYDATNATGPLYGQMRMQVESAVPHAALQVGLASLPAPLLALGAFGLRRWRMR